MSTFEILEVHCSKRNSVKTRVAGKCKGRTYPKQRPVDPASNLGKNAVHDLAGRATSPRVKEIETVFSWATQCLPSILAGNTKKKFVESKLSSGLGS